MPGNLSNARTAAFATIAFAELAFSFACRSQRYTLPQLGAFSNPWLIGAIAASAALQVAVLCIPPVRSIFGAAAAPPLHWVLIVALSLTPVSLVEVSKIIASGLRKRRVKQGNEMPV